MACYNFQQSTTRRRMLQASACGFGQLALAAMLGGKLQSGGNHLLASENLSNKIGHNLDSVTGPRCFPQRAQRVIFLFMWGGPSHVDLFDPKPTLARHEGQDLDATSVGFDSSRSLGKLIASPFKFSQHGESGVWISEVFPHLARHADQLCVIRSLHTEGSAHGEALLRLHTGQSNLVRPSVGAWVSYGLGRETDEVPAFITISPPRGHGGVQNYGSAFLPARHQGTAIGSAELPIASAKVPYIANTRWSPQVQRDQLDLLQQLNQTHLEQLGADAGVEGLIANYELAYRMQSQIPQVMDLDQETPATLAMYGINQQPTDNFGRQCLLARKFAEAGARYIQVSTDYTWDHHTKVVEGTRNEAAKVDLPIAGLLADLRQRGMLEDTLVVWGAEFGRTPMVENGDGRNHHPQGFTMWTAGGGTQGGLTYGATDDFGYRPVEKPMHMHDLHATLLYALGFDHQRLVFTHSGREFRLTDVHGKIATALFS